MQKYVYPPCWDLVRWHFATWVFGLICHRDKRGESQREKNVQRSSTRDDPVEGNEGGMHRGNSEVPSSQMITDTVGKCRSRIDFFFPIVVITMLFKYADMCCAEMQLHKAWKTFWCILFYFLFFPRVAMDWCVCVPVPEGSQFDGRSDKLGRSCNRCGAFPKVQSLYGRAASCKIISLCFSKNSSTCHARFHSCYLWRSWQHHPGSIHVRIWGHFHFLSHVKNFEAMWLTTTAAAKAL